jgi:hypothetical protein
MITVTSLAIIHLLKVCFNKQHGQFTSAFGRLRLINILLAIVCFTIGCGLSISIPEVQVMAQSDRLANAPHSGHQESISIYPRQSVLAEKMAVRF